MVIHLQIQTKLHVRNNALQIVCNASPVQYVSSAKVGIRLSVVNAIKIFVKLMDAKSALLKVHVLNALMITRDMLRIRRNVWRSAN